MKKYQEPTVDVVRFDMLDRITEGTNDDDYPVGNYSESVEIWE